MKLYPPESLHADAQSKQQIDIKNDIKPSIGNHSKQLIIESTKHELLLQLQPARSTALSEGK
jgi:hypothetical protein